MRDGRGARAHVVTTTAKGAVLLTMLATGLAVRVVLSFVGAEAPLAQNGPIAFVSVRDGNHEIYVMAADGSGQTNLTNNPAQDDNPAWSPDGTKIAFQSDRGGNVDLYVMNADGSAVTQLTHDAGANVGARWSSDGSTLVFASYRDGNFEIYTVRIDGTGATRLTADSGADINPHWSPDGTKIAFQSDRSQTGKWDIYVMSADGADATRLTSNGEDNNNPVWSRDGSTLLFWGGASNAADVFVMHAEDGSGVVNLSNDPADDTVPAWSPDGTKIAFSSNRGGVYGIWAMGVDGSVPMCLSQNGDTNPDWARAATPTPATPHITWPPPAPLTYGTLLGPAQLNATSDVAGAFTYAPSEGALLAAGNQTLSATFTPFDPAAYAATTATVSINVAPATPIVTWAQPAGIPYGTSLSGTQLNATANVPGVFVYTPPPVTVLPVGAAQTLSVTFVPADAVNYTTVRQTVAIDVYSASAPTQPTYQLLHQFAGADGANPQASLIQGQDGAMYATTSYGGIGNGGTVYRMDTDGELTTLYAFSVADGSVPVAGLTQGTDGSFYGTTTNAGAVYRLNASGAFTRVRAFSGTVGAYPSGGLVQATDSKFYGTAAYGGPNGVGTVYRLESDNRLTLVHAFTGADGSYPFAGLIQGRDGDFYGTTMYGGAGGGGTIYRMAASGATTVLHAFSWGDGAYPYAALLQGSDGLFYGTTTSGGPSGAGTVYRVDAAGSMRTLHAFQWDDGADPRGVLVQGRDGFFYGTTSKGGPNGAGTVYRLDAAGNLTTLHAFTGIDGGWPTSGLVAADDGFLYGAAYGGAADNVGVIFRVTLVAGNAPSELQVPPATGSYGSPLTMSATLTAADAPLVGEPVRFTWGPTPAVVAVTDTTGVATATVNLNGVSVGSYTLEASFAGDAIHAAASATGDLNVAPAVPTIVWPAPADIHYGTPLSAAQLNAAVDVQGTLTYDPPAGTVLRTGALQPLTVVFRPSDTTVYSVVTATRSITVLKAEPRITWANPADLFSPKPLGPAQLNAVADVPGTFAYTPAVGTVLPVGLSQTLTAVFVPTDPDTYTTVIATARINVVAPTPVVTWARPAAIVYGTALSGTQLNATANIPGAFEYIPPIGTLLPVGVEQTLTVTFVPTDSVNYSTISRSVAIDVQSVAAPVQPTYQVLQQFSGANGSNPQASLIQGLDGAMYSTTSYGGTSNGGTVYRIAPSGAVTTTHVFGGAAGSAPMAGLTQGSDGSLYGTTTNSAAVFRLGAGGSVSRLRAFTWTIGSYPSGGVVQGTDGWFYGTAAYGGDNGVGSVYRLEANNRLTLVHAFTGTDGSYPYAPLIQARDGAFYGTTTYGGTGGGGTVYRMTASGTTTVLHAFTWGDGAYPYAGLLQGSDGLFYGTTSSGGSSGAGTVFRVDAAGSTRTLHAFRWDDGADPRSGLVQGRDGFFYGTTSKGGPSGAGTVYRMDAAGNLTTLYSFTGVDGAWPMSGLVAASDGFLYGAASGGGAQNAGVVFRMTMAAGTAPSQLEVTPVSGFYGRPVNVSATLSAAGAPLVGGIVRFAWGSGPPVPAVTDANGVATATVNLSGATIGGHTIQATFGGDAGHAGASGTGNLQVAPGVPTIVWPAPADIHYGTPLGAAQLNAVVDIPGTMSYNQPPGTVLSTGATQPLSVVFTPYNQTLYTGGTATRSITVLKAVPRITWANPDEMASPAPLGLAQLNAVADVPGTFAYTPAANTVLPVGRGQTLTAVFTPSDTANYAVQTASVLVDVVTPEQLTGNEELSWEQGTNETTNLGSLRYALYVDTVRRELNGVSCTALEVAGRFLCSVRIPTLAPGVHRLELGTFTIAEAILFESARSAPLLVVTVSVGPPPAP